MALTAVKTVDGRYRLPTISGKQVNCCGKRMDVQGVIIHDGLTRRITSLLPVGWDPSTSIIDTTISFG